MSTRTRSAMFKLRNILLFCLLACTGCSDPQPRDEHAQEAENETATAETPTDVPEIPDAEGVYGIYGDKQTLIEKGRPELLMQTNAERGFGFSVPVGRRVSSGTGAFRINTRDLNVTQLGILRLRGVAVETESPFSPVDDTNTAWIPGEIIPADFTVYDETRGLAELVPNRPLEPGFYVIHDNSMLTGRRRSDVTAYHPFVILRHNADPWTLEAEHCFEAAKSPADKGFLRNGRDKANRASLLHCVQLQRLSLKAANNSPDPAQASLIRMRTIYLAKLLDNYDRETHFQMRNGMSAQDNGVAFDLWLLEYESLMTHLGALYRQTAAGDKPNPKDLMLVLDHYRPLPQFKKALADRPARTDTPEPLETLAWIPFARIEKTVSNPSLADTFYATLQDGGAPAQNRLIERIGAIEYNILRQYAQTNKAAAQLLKRLDAEIPKVFATHADRIHLRANPTGIILGPYSFDGVPDSELSAWRATFESKKNEVTSCLANPTGVERAFFVLRQPLNGPGFGRESMGTLWDPAAEGRKKQPLSPAEIQCILKVFSSLAFEPSLENTQNARVGLTILPTGE